MLRRCIPGLASIAACHKWSGSLRQRRGGAAASASSQSIRLCAPEQEVTQLVTPAQALEAHACMSRDCLAGAQAAKLRALAIPYFHTWYATHGVLELTGTAECSLLAETACRSKVDRLACGTDTRHHCRPPHARHWNSGGPAAKSRVRTCDCRCLIHGRCMLQGRRTGSLRRGPHVGAVQPGLRAPRARGQDQCSQRSPEDPRAGCAQGGTRFHPASIGRHSQRLLRCPHQGGMLCARTDMHGTWKVG